MAFKISNIILMALQVFFVTMNWTVEKEYCAGPLNPNSKGLFIKDTVDFSIKYNPLFHARPEWLVKATCISAYTFWIVYAAIFFVAYFDAWGKSSLLTRVFIPVGIGIKLNAIFFYHFMEFTSDMPPQHLVPYFAAEGGYIVAIGLVLHNLAVAAKKDKRD